MDSDGSCKNSQVSASEKWLTLAALTYNWQLKLANSLELDDNLGAIQVLRNADVGGGGSDFQGEKTLRRCNVQCY